MQKKKKIKYASIINQNHYFIDFFFFSTAHHMHAYKGPTLKNVNVHQVYSLDRDSASVYAFIYAWEYMKYGDECFTFYF